MFRSKNFITMSLTDIQKLWNSIEKLERLINGGKKGKLARLVGEGKANWDSEFLCCRNCFRVSTTVRICYRCFWSACDECTGKVKKHIEMYCFLALGLSTNIVETLLFRFPKTAEKMCDVCRRCFCSHCDAERRCVKCGIAACSDCCSDTEEGVVCEDCLYS